MVDVLHCDNHLLVLNKPSDMVTQPDGINISLEERAKAWVKKEFQKPGNVFLEAIHRLDKPVSGIVVFARTSKSLSRMQAFSRSSLFQKEYLALVEGVVTVKEGELKHFLHRASFRTSPTSKDDPLGKRCRLKFHLLKVHKGHSLLKISLITGRYHQIRAQLAAWEYPILGDWKYGSQLRSKKLCLHHASFKAPHPTTGEHLCWYAPLPNHWPLFSSVDLAPFSYGGNCSFKSGDQPYPS